MYNNGVIPQMGELLTGFIKGNEDLDANNVSFSGNNLGKIMNMAKHRARNGIYTT